MARRLGDRVPHWLTQNEPYCVSWLGYALGLHAPGRTELRAAIAAAHHVLLSHGLAVEALRRECPAAEVGIVLDSWPVYPASDDPRDADGREEQDGFRNRLFFDPVLRGSYPEDVLEHLGDSPPPVRDGDLAAISAPIDFVGLNNYSRTIVEADSRRKAAERHETAARRRRWAGRSTRTGSTTSSPGCTASTASRTCT